MQTSTTGAIYAAGKDNTKITYDANAKAILSNGMFWHISSNMLRKNLKTGR